MNITMLLIYINMRRFGRGDYFVCPEGGNEIPPTDKSQTLFAAKGPWRRK